MSPVMRPGLMMVIAILLCLGVSSQGRAEGELAAAIASAGLTVVDDKSYAPFAFLDAEGNPRGISVDIWKLWSLKTGIPVRMRLMEWESALHAVQSGTADVVAGLFRTPEREAIFDFTSSFFSISTSIFFHRSIHGLRGLNDLQGFAIGVVKGDSAEEAVRSALPSARLETFVGAEELVGAAVAGKIRVFVVDTHSGRFYLAKRASNGQFNEALTPIGDNRQYAAVRKGNRELLDLVQRGFDRISPEEIQGIVDRWAGRSLVEELPWRLILTVGGCVLGVVALLFLWNMQLKRAVRAAESEILRRNEDLLQSRQKYQEIFDATVEMVFIHDVQTGEIVDVNRAAIELSGMPKEELIGKEVGVFSANLPTYTSDRARELIREAAAIGQKTFEWPVCHSSGEVFWTEVVLRSSQVAGQQRVIAVVRNISERRRSDELLRKSEERFRSLVAGTLDPMLVMGFDGRVRFANRAVFELLELPEQAKPEEIGMAEFLSPESMKDALKHLETMQRERHRIISEYELRTRKGSEKSIEAIGHIVCWEGQDCDLITIRDITQRKRVERFLQAQNDLLVSLMTEGKLFSGGFEQAVAGITEAWGKLLGISRTSVWIYSEGYTHIRCIDAFMLTSEEHRSGEILDCSRFPEYVKRHCQGQPILAEDVFTHPHTSGIPQEYWREHDIKSLMDIPIWLGQEVRGLLSFEAVGEQRRWTTDEARLATVIGTMISLSYEISERKRAVEERERLQEQLLHAQKMESVGRLAGGVAHDFNNMLAAILGYVELALNRIPPSDPLRELMLEIQKAGTRSADLTRQLLGFARKQTVVPKVLDLNETIEGMLGMLRRIIGENIALEWAPGKDLGLVKIDPTQVDQILANLCVNSRDAIAGVGRISIETANEPLEGTLGFIRLTVRDTGCGMDQVTKERIFDPFFTTKEVGKGTGLGLATVYGIVSQNNGKIEVESSVGSGTAFHLSFQRVAGEPGRPNETASCRLETHGTGTILLVEDESAILKLGAQMLQALGYTVLAAARPGEALEIAERHHGRIDLLMTDVIMPEMNGKDLAQRLTTRNPGLAVLFMSGYTANVIAEQGLAEEHVRFLQKPFTMDALDEQVRMALASAPARK